MYKTFKRDMELLGYALVCWLATWIVSMQEPIVFMAYWSVFIGIVAISAGLWFAFAMEGEKID